MRIKKTFAAAVATAGLAGGALALVAPSAAFAATPPAGDTALAGTATIAGTPSADIDVNVYQVAADGTSDRLGETETEADGTYYFDFDTNATNDGSNVDTPDPGTVLKLRFDDNRNLTGDQLAAHYQFYAGQPTLAQATPIAQPGAGTTSTVATVALALESGVKGTVAVPAPAGYLYYGYVVAYDADDQQVGQSYFDNDPTTTGPNDQSTYLLRSLDPNQSYTLRAYAYSYSPTDSGQPVSYVSQFYKSGSTFADATPVAVGASGTVTQPIDWSLSNALTATEMPSIKGQVAPGRTLSVDNGTWSAEAGTTYAYQWLVGGTVKSTAPTYVVQKADLGKKVQVVVTATYLNYNDVTNQYDQVIGTAMTSSVKVKYASKLQKTKAKATYVKGKRVVDVTGKVKVQGVKKKKLAKALRGAKVTVVETDVNGVDHKVGKAKVTKKGTFVVVVKGLTAGKHELTVEVGGRKIASATKTVKAKV